MEAQTGTRGDARAWRRRTIWKAALECGEERERGGKGSPQAGLHFPRLDAEQSSLGGWIVHATAHFGDGERDAVSAEVGLIIPFWPNEPWVGFYSPFAASPFRRPIRPLNLDFPQQSRCDTAPSHLNPQWHKFCHTCEQFNPRNRRCLLLFCMLVRVTSPTAARYRHTQRTRVLYWLLIALKPGYDLFKIQPSYCTMGPKSRSSQMCSLPCELYC